MELTPHVTPHPSPHVASQPYAYATCSPVVPARLSSNLFYQHDVLSAAKFSKEQVRFLLVELAWRHNSRDVTDRVMSWSPCWANLNNKRKLFCRCLLLLRTPTAIRTCWYISMQTISKQRFYFQLHILFNVAHEMRKGVQRDGGIDLLKVCALTSKPLPAFNSKLKKYIPTTF